MAHARNRSFADAALGFITSDPDSHDDDGSDEFHLICGIQHRFMSREDPMDDESGQVVLLETGIAVALGLLAVRADDPGVGARLCVEQIAHSIGMTPERIRLALGTVISGGVGDFAWLWELLLDHR